MTFANLIELCKVNQLNKFLIKLLQNNLYDFQVYVEVFVVKAITELFAE